MLDDTSRKLLRILSNMDRVPSLSELARKSGRTQGQVKMGLRVLTVERFIEWDPDKHNDLKVIQAWEFVPQPQQTVRHWEHD